MNYFSLCRGFVPHVWRMMLGGYVCERCAGWLIADTRTTVTQ